jgi:hypothetical protein
LPYLEGSTEVKDMVKVLIERHVQKGKEGYLVDLLNRMRTEIRPPSLP